MDNKRKGSNSQQTPSGSGRFEWDEAHPSKSGDTFNFADDDDEGPLPAPPEFDGERGSVPELLDGEEVVEEPIDDADLLDSAPDEPQPLHHSTHHHSGHGPPPIPVGASRGFIDDGEIALPPRMSHLVKSFPFRQVRAEDDPSAEENLDDETEELEPDEVEADELDPDDLESMTDAVIASPSGSDFRRPADAPLQFRGEAPAPGFRDHRDPRDHRDRSAHHEQDRDDADRASDPATGTGARWSFADLDRQAAVARPASWDDEDRSARSDSYDAPPRASTSNPNNLTAAGRARMFSDDPERSADTLADGQQSRITDDDTGIFPDVHDNAPTGLFARDELRAAAANPAFAALPTDDELELPIDDDASRSRRPLNTAPADDDDESTASFPARRLRDAADSMARTPVQLASDDDDAGGWVHARGPQPSAAIPVANIDDDDDATWDLPPQQLAAPVPAPPAPTPAPPPVPPPAPVTGDEDTIDAESSVGGWIATRPGASMASGIIAVDDFADDDVWPQPIVRKPSDAVAAPQDSDDEATYDARGANEGDEADDTDDEWGSQISPQVNLAPAPTDLGEPFPLDLWSDPDELVGRELGGCRLDRALSRGMFTRVYLAEERATGRRVAIRVLSPSYSPADARARQFLYEAQQLIKLRSEHIVEVLGAGTTSDHLTYYVMEYLEGETLASALRSEGPMPWADVAAFANQICDGLILAAERGVVHNDLTAATCMRLPGEQSRSEGERARDTIKLLGVGVTPLTSVYRNAEGTLAVSQGTPVGAAEFMAPEIAGGGRPDSRTAVYAVGVLMYELTTGRPPFRGDSFISVLKKQMYEEAVSPRLVVPEQEIPDVFEAVVARALAKAPGDRYSDLRALDEALLAARAHEGELRRVTQILALDPAFWDEDGSRRVKQASAPLRAASEPTPLSTFANDLKQRQPELAAAVFKSDRPSREPSMALHLTQLAAPIVAPALPPIQPIQVQAPPGQVLVLSRPPAPTSNLFRNVSLAVVIASVVVIAALWLSDQRGSGRKAAEVAADRRPSTTSKSKARVTRDNKRKADLAAQDDDPAPTVLAPPSEPEATVKQLPPPEPEPTPAPPPEPETPAVVKQPEPEPEPTPTPAPAKPVKTEKPPAAAVVPKTPPAKKVEPRDPLDDRPESITKGRLEAKLASMEPRVVSRCRSKAGVPDPRGLSVPVRVVVDVKGEVKANATGSFAGTPMGQCIEEVLEAIRFNETRSGGTHAHTFKF